MMDSPAQESLPLSPKKQFLAIFGSTPTFSRNLIRSGDRGDGSEDEQDEQEGEEEYEDEDEEEGNSSFRSSNSSIGAKLSYLESIIEEEDSSPTGETKPESSERIYPVIESSPEESRNGGCFDRLYSEKGAPLLPFGPSEASGSAAGFVGVIDSDTDHFGRPRASSRPNTPVGEKKKIEFVAAQPACIDCIIGSAGHHHGRTAERTPAPTPAPSRSSSLKLKEPVALTPVEEENKIEILENQQITTFTNFTPETTPSKSSATALLTPEATPLKHAHRQSPALNETSEMNTPKDCTIISSPTSIKVYSPPERPKLVTNYPVTPARPRGPQIPPTPPTTPANRKGLLHSRENSRENMSGTNVAPVRTITPPPGEVASLTVEAEESKIEEPKVEAPKIEELKKAENSEHGHGHGHGDGHDCPFLRRSASPRPKSSRSYSYSYSVPSTPEPVRPLSHSSSSPEVPRFTTHSHSSPSTPAPQSRLSYSLPGTLEASSSSCKNNVRPKIPEVARLISQEFPRPSTPEVVFSGSGTASPFVDISEPASRAPSPPPPSLAGGSTITTPDSSMILPSPGPLAPAIDLKGDSGVKSAPRGVSADFFPEQSTPPAPTPEPAIREPEKATLAGTLPESITVEVIHRLGFLDFSNFDPTKFARRLVVPLQFLSSLLTAMWLFLLPSTLLIWTLVAIAPVFVRPEPGSPMATFNPAWALLPFAVLFVLITLQNRSETGDPDNQQQDLLDNLIDRTSTLRSHLTTRRLRRAGITLGLAISLIAAFWALKTASPYVTARISNLANDVSTHLAPATTDVLSEADTWEDMDFVYFAPTGAEEEKVMSSAMEFEDVGYGSYYPREEADADGLGLRGVLRLGLVLVMGPAGAMALRRRTL